MEWTKEFPPLCCINIIYIMLINPKPHPYKLSHLFSMQYHNREATILAVWNLLGEFNSKGATCGRRNTNLSPINAFDLASDFMQVACFNLSNFVCYFF
jgi:hypothetical protein